MQLAAWAIGWLALRIVVRRHVERADLGRVAVALWVVAGLMLGASAGWWLNGVTGLDPARSQLAVHAASNQWRVAPFSVGRVSGGVTMAVHPDEPPLSDHPSPRLMFVGPVPAGDYQLEVSGRLDRPTVLTATIGRSTSPLTTVNLPAGPVEPRRMVPLSLPAGAAVLVIDANSPEGAAGVRVALRPTGPSTGASQLARRSATDGETTMFFIDEAVFVEPTGFWVRGGAETQVVWSGGPALAGRTRTLELQNGGAPNDVTVRMGGWQQTVALAPFQEHVVSLPAADATGSWRLLIASAAGFRPSELSGGDDRRYLGVWIGR